MWHKGKQYRMAFIATIYNKSLRLNFNSVVKQHALLLPTLNPDVVAGLGGKKRVALLLLLLSSSLSKGGGPAAAAAALLSSSSVLSWGRL
jgi:hypothetical protein